MSNDEDQTHVKDEDLLYDLPSVQTDINHQVLSSSDIQHKCLHLTLPVNLKLGKKFFRMLHTWALWSANSSENLKDRENYMILSLSPYLFHRSQNNFYYTC